LRRRASRPQLKRDPLGGTTTVKGPLYRITLLLCACTFSFLTLSCGSPTAVTPFAGTWVGINTVYSLELVLTQNSDTVQGALTFVRQSNHYQCTGAIPQVPLRGDSLVFQIAMPSPCTYGALQFAGLRRSDAMDGLLTIDTTTTLTLYRQ
jgi:hypothetical protein